MENNAITIGFRYTNEFGDSFSFTSISKVFAKCDEADIDFIGDQLNIFLKQCGYSRTNDHIFMADVTEEEQEALGEFLNQLRVKEKVQ